MTSRPPACTVASAINGLPTTTVATRSGSFTSLAWSSTTSMSPACAIGGAAKAAMPNARQDARMERTCRPRPARNNAIILSRTLRLGQPTGGRRMGRHQLQVDAKKVNEAQMAARLPAGSSLPEWIEHLRAEPGRDALVGHAIGLGQRF